MPFDPSTATEDTFDPTTATEDTFDPSTAEEMSFDPASASEDKTANVYVSEVEKDTPSTGLEVAGSLGNLLTFMPRALVGTLGGVYGAATGGSYAEDFNKYMEALAFPSNASLDEILALPATAAKKAGEYAFDATGSPLVGAGVETGLDALMMFGGARLAKGKAPQEKPGLTPEQLDAKMYERYFGNKEDTIPSITQRNEVVPKEQLHIPTAPEVAPTELTRPNPATRAEPINLSQFASEQGISDIIANTVGSFTPEQISGAKRGVVSFEQAKAMANATGYDAEFFLKNKIGSVYNAEGIQRFGDVLASSASEVQGLAKKAIQTGDNSDLLAFKKAQLVHSGLVSKFIGASGEQGRALNQLKAQKEAIDNAKFVQNIIDKFGKEDIQAMAEAMATTDNPRQLLAKGEEFHWSKPFFEVWRAGLLTGIKTQVKNLASNVTTNLLSIPERYTAATIGTVRNVFTKKNDNVSFAEANAYLKGYSSVDMAWTNFTKALKDENYLTEGMTKADVYQKYMTSEYFRQKFPNSMAPGSNGAWLIDNTGKVIRVPFRVLNATDVGFKTVAVNQQLLALATREGVKRGLKGDELSNFIETTIANPSKKMMEQASDWGHYLTMTSDLGPFARRFSSFVSSHNLGNLIMPFKTTPINLVKYYIDRTPLAFLSKNTRARIAAGGAEADMALGQIAVGTMMHYALGEMVANSIITAPSSIDPKQAQLESQADYKPFAIKINGEQHPIDIVDPIGSMVAMSGSLVNLMNFYEKDMKDLPKLDQTKKLYLYFLDTVNNVFIDKTYMKGISDLIESSKSEKGVTSFLEGLVKSTNPTIVRDLQMAIDPTIYDPTLDQALTAATPFVGKQNIKPALDMWGQPRVRPAFSMVNPFKGVELSKDPATLARIRYGITVPNPGPESKLLGLDYTEEDQFRWKQLQGKFAREFMTKLVDSPLFAKENPTAVEDKMRQAALQSANENASRMATAMLAVVKASQEKDQILNEKMKQLFPKPKRTDIVE